VNKRWLKGLKGSIDMRYNSVMDVLRNVSQRIGLRILVVCWCLEKIYPEDATDLYFLSNFGIPVVEIWLLWSELVKVVLSAQ